MNSEKALVLIADNPFAVLSVIDRTYGYDAVDNLLAVVKQLHKGKSIPSIDLYREMVIFSLLYNAFRPSRISASDYYFGTIKVIDNVYYKLSSFLNFEPPVRFSKQFESFLSSLQKQPKLDHGDIEWDDLIDDLEFVVDAIKLTMKQNAYRMITNIGSNLPYPIPHYALEYLKSFDNRLNDNNISLSDDSADEFLIHGKKVKIANEYVIVKYLNELEKT